MSRELRLIRRVVSAGGWAGDGAVWQGSDPGDAPKPAAVNAVELTDPRVGIADEHVGLQGIVRVYNASTRFYLRMVVGWRKIPTGGTAYDWQSPIDPITRLVFEPREIGDGEDFTTRGFRLSGLHVAFHLVPVGEEGAELPTEGVVEIWVREFE